MGAPGRGGCFKEGMEIAGVRGDHEERILLWFGLSRVQGSCGAGGQRRGSKRNKQNKQVRGSQLVKDLEETKETLESDLGVSGDAVGRAGTTQKHTG